MQIKRLLLLSSSLAAFTALAGEALAASAAPVGEVVVTAEKREQNLQNVPVSISAFTAKQRDTLGITSIQDMSNFTPGLQYDTANDRISLRGIGRLTNVLSAEASVANYNDGVFETFAVQAGRSTLFLDRVEVLRGPQGTLYGRNAIGGAINQVSKRPTRQLYMEARLGYANYERSNLEFAMSGPLGSENVLFRIAGNWERQGEGWVKNVVPGMPSEGGVINQWFVEGQLQVRFNDRLEMWTKFGSGKWDNEAGGPGSQSSGQANGSWTPLIYATNGAVLPFGPGGGNGWPIYEFANAGTLVNPGYGCSPNVTNVINPSPLGCVNPASADPWHMARAIPYTVKLPEYYTLSSHWTFHADSFDVKLVTGGVYYDYILTGSTPNGTQNAAITSFTLPGADPFNFCPANKCPGLTISPQSQFNYREQNGFYSADLTLLSTTAGRLSWIAGGYFFHQHYKQPVSVAQRGQAQLSGPLGAPAFFCQLTGGVCAPTIDRRWFDSRPAMSNTSLAAYGQFSYKVLDTLTFTGGVRYSHDHKYGRESVRILCFAVTACFFAPEFATAFGGLPAVDLTSFPFTFGSPVAGGTGAPGDALPRGVLGKTTYDPVTGLATRQYNDNWSAVTGTAKLEWRPDPDTLAYASYSRGYKSGGFNIGIYTVLSQLPWTDSEGVNAYEVGLKKTWGGRLTTDISAFYYDYQNLQIPIAVVGTGTGINSATVSFYNVPKSRSFGIELEEAWRPIDDLTVLLSYSYLDTKILEGTAVDPVDPAAQQLRAQPLVTFAQCQAAVGTASACPADIFTVGTPNGGFQRAQSLKGNRLPNAPKHKIALSGTYSFHFDGGDLLASATYIWRDVQFGALFTRWYNRAPRWDQFDARLTWRGKGDRYEIIAFGRNLTNNIGYGSGATGSRLAGTTNNIVPIPGGGSTVAPVNFVQGITKSYSVNPPRTYGVEVHYRFF